MRNLATSGLSRQSRYLCNLRPQLPRPIWVLQVGGFTNAIGDGLLLPFLVIYLHDVRGFSLSISGAVVAVVALAAFAASPIAGVVVDRIDGAPTLAAAMGVSATGLFFFPLAHSPTRAFLVAALLGAGEGGFRAAQSALLPSLTAPSARTSVFALQRHLSGTSASASDP